ncbi:hypothetical protein F1728_07915 [Gimesia benthica]|uniref:Uncharacterized protein n=1 Tax=Gimesia benthica TaxID=2608982 RepID=A0A6I6A8C5_9PLAN|nr:hypothetical protein [Gimesia benthica]QGQ22607.1 hypothetical protein F1728_07915 [Gimesia benthica]
MIRPVASTHKEASERAELVRQAEEALKAAERQTLKDNLAYGLFVLIATSGAILIGKLIAVIVQSLV